MTLVEKTAQLLAAHIKANIYATFHWSTRIHVECEWIRRPGHAYSEHTRFVGIVNSRHEIIRRYFGESKLYPEVIYD